MLCRDHHWGVLLRRCKALGVYTGVRFQTPLESDDESDTENYKRAADCDKLLLDSSQAIQQEGAPMPNYE